MHGLGSFPNNLINQLPQGIKLIWFAWGYDIYTYRACRPFISISLYHPLTAKVIKGNIINQIRLFHAKVYAYCKRVEINKQLARIDFFSGVLQNEYDLMLRNKSFRAQKLDFNYFRLNSEIRIENINAPYVHSNNILIGNSGDPTNNHLDIFDIIYKKKIINNKVYSFLSYGGNEIYREVVKASGKLYFKDKFIPIDVFLTYDKFNNLIMDCGNVIMAHERQQAVGNIIQSLWNGCKVFLSETSIAYKYFKECGYHLYTIQKDLNLETINCNIPFKYILDNRKLLIENFSPLYLMKKIYDICDIIDKKK